MDDREQITLSERDQQRARHRAALEFGSREEFENPRFAYRRLFTINRGAESRGRVPDFDRYVQEHEYEGLLGQLASGQQTGLFQVSIYEKLRARGLPVLAGAAYLEKPGAARGLSVDCVDAHLVSPVMITVR